VGDLLGQVRMLEVDAEHGEAVAVPERVFL
jgi:hypothetical protein